MILTTSEHLMITWKCSCGAVSAIYSDDKKWIEKARKEFEKRHKKCDGKNG